MSGLILDAPARPEAVARGHRLVDRQGDLVVEAWGQNVGSAFEEAALALVSLLVDPSTIEPRRVRSIEVHAHDPDELLVRWLEEVADLTMGGFALDRLSIRSMTKTALRARGSGEPLDQVRHRARTAVRPVPHSGTVVDSGGRSQVRFLVDL